ncbi:MAG: hypothetical protein ABF904_03775 [Ethanoligenens sp.]
MNQHVKKTEQVPVVQTTFLPLGDVDGRQDISEARSRGMQEGLACGFQSGSEQVLRAARIQIEEEQAVTESERIRLQTQTRQALAAKQMALPALAVKEARQALSLALHRDDEAYLHLFAQAAAHVGPVEHAVLRANAYGCGIASRHLEWMKKQIDGLQSIEIRQTDGDDGLCVLETEAGSLDASVKTQFQKALQVADLLDQIVAGD